jgi:hypothetical protein
MPTSDQLSSSSEVGCVKTLTRARHSSTPRRTEVPSPRRLDVAQSTPTSAWVALENTRTAAPSGARIAVREESPWKV